MKIVDERKAFEGVAIIASATHPGADRLAMIAIYLSGAYQPIDVEEWCRAGRDWRAASDGFGISPERLKAYAERLQDLGVMYYRESDFHLLLYFDYVVPYAWKAGGNACPHCGSEDFADITAGGDEQTTFLCADCSEFFTEDDFDTSKTVE